MQRFKLYRKFRGGRWFLNRYWFDAGRGLMVLWERKGYTCGGGPICTLLCEFFPPRKRGSVFRCLFKPRKLNPPA